MEKLKLALDWTPNINHFGFLVAQEKGLYAQQGIELQIIHPGMDNYAETPAKKVELGKVDFALCPTESLISYQTKDKPFPLIGISAVFQRDLSAIVTLAKSGIASPKQLDGKSYASYQARYEDSIVEQMIKNDGGKGEIKIGYPEKLGIWNTLINAEYDATWIFTNWEGVEAAQSQLELNIFRLEDYDIPYSYSPVIACNAQKIEERSDVLQAFLKASKSGFLYANEKPEECTEILSKYVPKSDNKIDLQKALSISLDSLEGEAGWGTIEVERVAKFLNFLRKHNLENSKIKAADLVKPLI